MMLWLVIAVVGFILYKLVTNEMRKRTEDKNAAETKERKTPTGDMVKDPVCGTYVDVTSSVSVRDGAQVHRFCSYECRDTFLEQLRATGRNIPKTNAETAELDSRNDEQPRKKLNCIGAQEFYPAPLFWLLVSKLT